MDKFLELEKKVKELFNEAIQNEVGWRNPKNRSIYPEDDKFRKIIAGMWGAKKRSYRLILSIMEDRD